MPKSQRITIFVILMLCFGGIFYLWKGNFYPKDNISIVIYSSLIMLSFASLFLEHFFTKPTDVLASATSILLLLAPLRNDLTKLGYWYEIFVYYNLAIAIIALGALLALDHNRTELSFQNKASIFMTRLVASAGNCRLLFFSLFIVTMLFYIDSNSIWFIVLFAYSAIILIIDPKKSLPALISFKNKNNYNDVGKIIGVQSKNIFLAKLFDNRKPVRRFDLVKFIYSIEGSNKERLGIIIDNYLLNQSQWIKILATPDIADILDYKQENNLKKSDIVYHFEKCDISPFLNKFVGLVVDKSNINKIRFEYGGKIPVAEGNLLEIVMGNDTIYYQIVQGVTEIEPLEQKNEAGIIIGEAVQLGRWDPSAFKFDKYGWVPSVNTPVYIARMVEYPVCSGPDYIIGHIPGSRLPVVINKEEAISHHMAILGVTGSGKSVFARNFIREIIKIGKKVICVDFTREYERLFGDLAVASIINGDNSEKMFAAIDTINIEMDKFANQRNRSIIDNNQETLKIGFRESIKSFLTSDKVISVFELPDVANSTGILEYTKWFFKILFDIAKLENNFGKQVCVVLEEAHTVIPEWNFVGIADKNSQALVNSIGQIALQGRKHNVGFIVIAQRTANVSKTILTQCNTIIAFQQFDNTSSDFLVNYMGDNMVSALSALKTRQAVAVGRALKSGVPIIFEVPEIQEEPSC